MNALNICKMHIQVIGNLSSPNSKIKLSLTRAKFFKLLIIIKYLKILTENYKIKKNKKNII